VRRARLFFSYFCAVSEKMKSVLRSHIDQYTELLHEVSQTNPSVRIGVIVSEILRRHINPSEIVHWVSDNPEENKSDSRCWYLVLCVIKSVMDIQTQKSLCLTPPDGVRIEEWQCCFGFCKNFDTRVSNILAIKKIRENLRLPDPHSEEDYQRFIDTWGDVKREKGKYRPKVGWKSPLVLFPVASLHPSVKEEIIANFPYLSRIVDRFFICGEHFTEPEGTKKPFRKRDIRTHSIELINCLLRDGIIKLDVEKRRLGQFYQKLTEINSLSREIDPVEIRTIEKFNTSMEYRHQTSSNVESIYFFNFMQEFNKGLEPKPA